MSSKGFKTASDRFFTNSKRVRIERRSRAPQPIKIGTIDPLSSDTRSMHRGTPLAHAGSPTMLSGRGMTRNITNPVNRISM